MSYGMQQNAPYAQQAPYQGGDQQQYYNQQQQPGGAPPPQGYYQGKDDKMALKPDNYQGQRFEPSKPKFNDIPFAILFICVFGGFVAVSVISLYGFSNSSSGTISTAGGVSRTLNGQTAVILMFSSALALVLSVLYIFLVRTFPKIILEATLALSVLTTIAYCVYLWVKGQTAGAIIMTIFAVLGVVAYFFMRKRIPLAKIILISVIRAADHYKSTYVMALSFLVVQTAFSVWATWTLVAVYQRFSPDGNAAGSGASSGAVTGLVVLVVFAYYWTSEVIKAVAYTSVAGIFGVWYYNQGPDPRHVALSSLRRCLTYSFGSLCFGSLILAILDIIRAIVYQVQQQEASQGDMVGFALSCVLGCIIGCIDWLITFFNRLAYTNIALYGNSFITASKETWQLVKQKGIDALINDSLINNVWVFGSYAIGLGCGIFAYAYLSISDPEYVQNDSSYFSVIIFFAIGLGLNIALSLGSGSIGTGCTTMFVCLAEDPAVIAQKDPELFEALRQAYPQVIHPIDH